MPCVGDDLISNEANLNTHHVHATYVVYIHMQYSAFTLRSIAHVFNYRSVFYHAILYDIAVIADYSLACK